MLEKNETQVIKTFIKDDDSLHHKPMRIQSKTRQIANSAENADGHIVIGFCFASDWLRGWRDGPIAERVKAKAKS